MPDESGTRDAWDGMVDGAPPTKSLDPYATSIVETVRQPLVVLDAELRVLSANRAFYTTFHVLPESSVGGLLYELGDRQWDIPELRELLEEITGGGREIRDYEFVRRFPAIGRRAMLLNACRLRAPVAGPPLILLAMEDVTDRKRVEETHQLLLAATSHDVLNVLNNIMGYAQLFEERDFPEPVVPRILSLSMGLREIMRELLDHADADNDQPSLALVSARALMRERAAAVEWQCRQKGLEFARRSSARGVRHDRPDQGNADPRQPAEQRRALHAQGERLPARSARQYEVLYPRTGYGDRHSRRRPRQGIPAALPGADGAPGGAPGNRPRAVHGQALLRSARRQHGNREHSRSRNHLHGDAPSPTAARLIDGRVRVSRARQGVDRDRPTKLKAPAGRRA